MGINFSDSSFYKWAKDSITALQGLNWASLSGKPATFPPSSHNHTVGDITDFNTSVDARIASIVGSAPAALDTLQELAAALGDDEDFAGTVTAALSGKSSKASFTALSTLPAHGISNAATNAATNAPTNLNVLTTLLGSLTGEVNATNAKQNDLAAMHNDLAGKFNTLLTKVSAMEAASNGIKDAGAA